MEILEIKGLSKKFGGLHALYGVDLNVDEREFAAIIGPNGAGKTTLFNAVTGHLRPDSGTVIFKGEIITGRPPHEIARRGISRAFQLPNVFCNRTALENIRMGLLSYRKLASNLFSSVDNLKEINEESLRIINQVGLSGTENYLAGALPHGHQKALELGISLAYKPELLLLDEPTTGMNPEETKSAMELILSIWKSSDLAVIFVEHDMDVVFSVAKRIIVMNEGKIVADGRPDDIKGNEEVRRIYLGT